MGTIYEGPKLNGADTASILWGTLIMSGSVICNIAGMDAEAPQQSIYHTKHVEFTGKNETENLATSFCTTDIINVSYSLSLLFFYFLYRNETANLAWIDIVFLIRTEAPQQVYTTPNM